MNSKILPQRVRDYWDQYTSLYLEHMTTFQAGLFAQPFSSDPFAENALEIARRAEIEEGHSVLDLGCGVCGPAIEIAKHYPNTLFVCVTDCKDQIDVARARVVDHGLEKQIKLVHLDYHKIDLIDGQFDRCLFLESFGYTLEPSSLLGLVFKKLREGGSLYIKDICHNWHMTEAQKIELSEFNKTYCYNTPLFRDVIANTRSSGFSVQKQKIVTGEMYRAHSKASMFVNAEFSNELTEFGRRHFKGFVNLPVDFYELKAIKPMQIK